MRRRLFEIIEKAKNKADKASHFYDVFIVAVALASLIPLMFKKQSALLYTIDTITVYFLFADYVFRWMTYDMKTQEEGNWKKFIIYPFTPYAIIDIISLLPSLGIISGTWRVLRLLRVSKIVHYSKSLTLIGRVFKNESKTLLSVLIIAIFYIFVSALVMFTQEPQTFDTFFDALYWATTALTTVGYRDIYPRSDLGQLISMISSLFGIAVIALVVGVYLKHGGKIDLKRLLPAWLLIIVASSLVASLLTILTNDGVPVSVGELVFFNRFMIKE